MKFCSSVLTICLVQANAFHAPKPRRITALKSTPFGAGDPSGFFNSNDRSIDNNNPTSETSGPLSNLNKSPIGDDIDSNSKSMKQLPPAVKVQGRALRTWSFATPTIQRVQVQLKTEGRPLNANIDLWQGPDNCPQKMAVYVEDGSIRPFNSLIETPGGENAVAIRNTASMEYPLYATVEAGHELATGADAHGRFSDLSNAAIVQGGSIKTYTFGFPVDSIQIMLKTDGRPMNARIELLQGPNNNKQVVDLYSENGTIRPFYCAIETPGSGNVVRIINTAPMEFPLTAVVEPLEVSDGFGDDASRGNNKPGWDSTNDSSFFFLGG